MPWTHAMPTEMDPNYDPPSMSLTARKADSMDLDAMFYLVGDEDCGVGINCRICDRGGAPVAYYAGISRPYPADWTPRVENVETIAGLLAAAEDHARSHA